MSDERQALYDALDGWVDPTIEVQTHELLDALDAYLDSREADACENARHRTWVEAAMEERGLRASQGEGAKGSKTTDEQRRAIAKVLDSGLCWEIDPKYGLACLRPLAFRERGSERRVHNHGYKSRQIDDYVVYGAFPGRRITPDRRATPGRK